MSDIFKKAFLEGFQTDLTLEKMLLTLLITLLLSFFVFFMYRATIRDVPFSKGFAVSMGMVSVVTAAIILAVQSSIVISLGMVGALSIVRFRTAIKNPMDLLYLFWSISLGIITGAGLYALSVACCLVVALGITVYQLIPLKKAPQLLIVKCEGEEAEEAVLRWVGGHYKKYAVKSRSLVGDTTELIIELPSVKDPGHAARDAKRLPGVVAVTMLQHDGETIAQ